MLDGAGKIRITDFGLAAIAASIQSADVRAGTPAYMAPEQLAGKEVTTKSDIYSLGLILYEILTGKRAFEASTLPELIKLREQGTITNPSTLVRDLDPLIERVILRCLETDPAKRPYPLCKLPPLFPAAILSPPLWPPGKLHRRRWSPQRERKKGCGRELRCCCWRLWRSVWWRRCSSRSRRNW